MPEIYGFDDAFPLGSVVPPEGRDICDDHGYRGPAIPMYIIREATYEEYVESLRAVGQMPSSLPELRRHGVRHFYEVSVD